MSQTKIKDTENRFRRKIEMRLSDGDNRTNTTTTPTWTGWNESYTAGDHDETLYITINMMARNTNTADAFYATLYVDAVSQGHRLYCHGVDSWAHQTLSWKVNVDAGVTISIEPRQWTSSGGTAQIYSNTNTFHRATMTIRTEMRESGTETKTSLMDGDHNTDHKQHYYEENRRTSVFTSTSTSWTATGVYENYTAGDEDETVVIEVQPMYLQQTSGWGMLGLFINGEDVLTGRFYSDSGSHWRRTSRKWVVNVNAGATIRAELYADVSAGTVNLHYSPGSYCTVFQFIPYPRQDYQL